ncbi:MAG: hypothetical protein MN733_25155, partial [Nitrososphaera sp.]|nr:hypothetical protein [Nitrososphaera sp.]
MRSKSKVRYEESAIAVREFANLVHEPRARAYMLHSAIVRNAPILEVQQYKQRYDEAFVTWSVKLQAALLNIRRAITPPAGAEVGVGRSDVEGIVEITLEPMHQKLEECVAAEYYARVDGRKELLTKCEVQPLLAKVEACS